MDHLSRRVARLETRSQAQDGTSCLLVYRYRGESLAEALKAEGYHEVPAGQVVIIVRRDFRARALGPPARTTQA
jgi:hypothetical protein